MRRGFRLFRREGRGGFDRLRRHLRLEGKYDQIQAWHCSIMSSLELLTLPVASIHDVPLLLDLPLPKSRISRIVLVNEFYVRHTVDERGTSWTELRCQREDLCYQVDIIHSQITSSRVTER